MRTCLYSAAPRGSRRQTSTIGRRCSRGPRPTEPLGCKASLGGRARLVVVSRVLSEGRVVLSTPRGPQLLQQPWHRAGITAARRLRQRFHSACKLRPSLGSRRLAMKLVVALALPAAALRPVQVTMSAAQNRRAFVIGGTAAAAAAATKANAYSLPDLPYAYDALEPSIDAATMKFHHGACPAYRDVASRESAAPRRRRDPSQTSTTRPTWRASTASSTRRTSRRSPI